MEYTVIRGESVEEKLASVDTALRQLNRRINIPKLPISFVLLSGYSKGETFIFKGLIPFDAVIKQVSIFIESEEHSLPKGGTSFEIESIDPLGNRYYWVVLAKGNYGNAFLTIKVKGGSRVTVRSVSCICDVWYGVVLELAKPTSKEE